MEAVGTAVEAVAVVVDGEPVDGVIEGEAALVDAVAVAADECAEVAVDVDVVVDIVVAEDYVDGVAVAAGNHQGYYTSAEIGDACFHAGVVAEYEKGGGVAVDGCDEARGVEA